MVRWRLARRVSRLGSLAIGEAREPAWIVGDWQAREPGWIVGDW
ncbi:hypothetical protein [Paenibacillus lignilyticus]|nr:hypothetical protein [Paenibacillus lignilyticus]